MDKNYEINEQGPSVEEYIHLRKSAGMSERSLEAATRGLINSWYAVSIRHDGKCIAMGRIVGDDGCVFHVVDIAVVPERQRQGLGSVIMQKLMNRLHEAAPRTAIVTMLADGEAFQLYEKFGFKITAPASQGMILRL